MGVGTRVSWREGLGEEEGRRGNCDPDENN